MAQNEQAQEGPNNEQPRQPQGPADATALLRDILDQQKNDILDAVSSFVNTKFDTFQTKIDETQQKITDAVHVEKNLSSLDSYKFKKKHFERQYKFNKSVRTKTSQALSLVSSGKIDKARQLLSSGISELDHQQKFLKLADISHYGWLVINEYEDNELAADEEDAKRIRKAEKSAASKFEKLKKGFRSRHKAQILTFIIGGLQLKYQMFSHAQYIETVILTFLITQIFFFVHNDTALSTCQISVGDVEKQVTRKVLCLSTTSIGHYCQSAIKFNPDKLKFRQGKLKENLAFQKTDICASGFVLDITENGYKIPFMETPPPFSFKSRSSAFKVIKHGKFVEEAIQELLNNDCIEELTQPSSFISPLQQSQITPHF